MVVWDNIMMLSQTTTQDGSKFEENKEPQGSGGTVSGNEEREESAKENEKSLEEAEDGNDERDAW